MVRTSKTNGSQEDAVRQNSRAHALYWAVGRAVLLALVALVSLIAVAEVMVRSANLVPPELAGMEADPDLVWLPQRGDPRELTFLESPGHTPEKRRAIALGDSSVYGFGVADTEHFPAVLSRLTERLSVLNCAGPGFSTFQSLRVMETVVPREEPDLVIIANLWSDNNFDEFIDKEMMAARSKIAFRLFFHANDLLSGLESWRYLLAASGNAHSLTVGWGRQELENQLYRRVAINDYVDNLWRMVNLAEAQGAQVIFVLLASEVDLTPAELPGFWHPYRAAMRDVAAQSGYPLVDVPELFRQTQRPKRELFLDAMHPTATGHRIIAQAIHHLLDQARWYSGGSLGTAASGRVAGEYRDPYAAGPGKRR